MPELKDMNIIDASGDRDWEKVYLISENASDADLDEWYETLEYEGYDDRLVQWLKQHTTGKFLIHAEDVRFEKGVDVTVFSLWYAGQ